ncbi:Filamin-C [Liparis tanakae]|uniref:Filamin-C n=1 Tax=Liparis tanakae TaxID=230148 RepID=A0A4Z2IXW6_9TELE|nr:Filamin-C [Liparis tanakae]
MEIPLDDSKAIVDGNLKLILGMIWTLILHYSISMPMWDDEDEEESKKMTPKQRLLGWIQNKVPQLPIRNFNRDWRDGKALGALVDNCAPAPLLHNTPKFGHHSSSSVEGDAWLRVDMQSYLSQGGAYKPHSQGPQGHSRSHCQFRPELPAPNMSAVSSPGFTERKVEE